MKKDKKISIKDLYWAIEELNNGFMPDTKEFMEAVGDVEVLEEEEIYSQGFYFGLQLTTEAYAKNKNRVVKSIFE